MPPKRKRAVRRKPCRFCIDGITAIDYKDVHRLRHYTGDLGKLVSRRVTGTCARHQRKLTVALKRARRIALLPYGAN